MKVIIAGGRDYIFTPEDTELINNIHRFYQISEVVSGGASGADYHGEKWAYYNNKKVVRFDADWKTYGKAAGTMRNEQMAKYADAVILFPGGKGTNSMRKMAEKYGLIVLHDAEAH